LGVAGQDGSLISQSLLRKGEKVIGITRTKTNRIKNHINLGIDKDIEIKNGDIRNYSNIAKLIETYNPDKIFNFAAQSSVGKSFTSTTETIEGIVNGTLNILEVAKELKFKGRIFFAGSSEIFGLTKTAATINHDQNPQNPYAIAKQTSFNLVKFYRKYYQVNCLTGVLFNHESQLRPASFVTQKIIEGVIKAEKNKNHTINLGNINIKRDWGWAEEYIEAAQIMSEAKDIEDHVICTGKLTSLIDFIKIAFSQLDLDWRNHVTIDNSLKRKEEVIQNFGNPDHLEKKLQWKAHLNIEQIITKLIEFKIKRNQIGSIINH